MSRINRGRCVAHQVALGTLSFVLRRVMRDTRPPTDPRQSKAQIGAEECGHITILA